jgi:hypothetical protein
VNEDTVRTVAPPLKPQKYARFELPADGTVHFQIAHCDVIRDRESLYKDTLLARFKGKVLATGELRQFTERWALVAPALTAHRVVDPSLLPSIEPTQFSVHREYVAIPIAHATVAITVRTTGLGPALRSIEIVPVTADVAIMHELGRAAHEVASAIDESVAPIRDVLRKHGLPLTAGDAIAAGRLVLEQRARGARRGA